jgi:hypothetical protein
MIGSKCYAEVGLMQHFNHLRKPADIRPCPYLTHQAHLALERRVRQLIYCVNDQSKHLDLAIVG